MPKHQVIHTKFHKLASSALTMQHELRSIMSQEMFDEYIDTKQTKELLSMTADLPRYVIYGDVVATMDEKNRSFRKTLDTLVEAGETRLPFPEVLVEFDEMAAVGMNEGDMQMRKIRHFILLAERDEGVFCLPWMYVDTVGDKPTSLLSPCMGIGRVVRDVAETAKMLSDDAIDQDRNQQGSGVLYDIKPSVMFKKEKLTDPLILKWRDEMTKIHMATCSMALSAMIVLMHTRGITVERVAVDRKLNKSRVASGKETIRDHTVLRIGHTYDRSGKQVQHIDGRHMPVHWRAAHYRDQRWGTGLSKVKRILIKAMLINYVEGEEVPKHLPKEVTT